MLNSTNQKQTLGNRVRISFWKHDVEHAHHYHDVRLNVGVVAISYILLIP